MITVAAQQSKSFPSRGENHSGVETCLFALNIDTQNKYGREGKYEGKRKITYQRLNRYSSSTVNNQENRKYINSSSLQIDKSPEKLDVSDTNTRRTQYIKQILNAENLSKKE